MTNKTQAATDSVTSAVSANLQDALATIINKTVAGVDAASGFLQEQIPDVIHQLLMWKMISSAVYCVLGVVLIVGTTFFLVWAFRKPVRRDGGVYCGREWKEYIPTIMYDCDGDMVGTVVPVSVGAIVSYLAGIFMLNTEWLQIWIAPKVWLIEYAASLVKG